MSDECMLKLTKMKCAVKNIKVELLRKGLKVLLYYYNTDQFFNDHIVQISAMVVAESLKCA